MQQKTIFTWKHHEGTTQIWSLIADPLQFKTNDGSYISHRYCCTISSNDGNTQAKFNNSINHSKSCHMCASESTAWFNDLNWNDWDDWNDSNWLKWLKWNLCYGISTILCLDPWPTIQEDMPNIQTRRLNSPRRRLARYNKASQTYAMTVLQNKKYPQKTLRSQPPDCWYVVLPLLAKLHKVLTDPNDRPAATCMHPMNHHGPNVCSTLNIHLWKTQATRLKVCKRNSRKAATAMRQLNHGPNVYDLQWICT